MARITKKDIYAIHGITFNGEKIFSPLGWINPVLCDGNTKLGKGVWTFSTLAGTGIYHVLVNGMSFDVKGTCACDCVGCYAKSGRYNMSTCINANGLKTILSREYIDFLRRAIIAQIHADKITLCRIHASGDFVSDEYIAMWRDIVNACPDCHFWTYTKVVKAENAFDDCPNCNVVKSIIKGHGFNYGHCDYIIAMYELLMSMGVKVHICKCGFDKNQHCINCKGCVENDYVLFLLDRL